MGLVFHDVRRHSLGYVYVGGNVMSSTAERCSKCRRVIVQSGNAKPYTRSWIKTWWDVEKSICYGCGKQWFQ